MNAVTTTQSYLRPGFRTGPLQFAGARVWRLLCSHRPIEISRRTAGSDVRAACQSAAGAPTGVGTAGRTHTTCVTPVARKRITRGIGIRGCALTSGSPVLPCSPRFWFAAGSGTWGLFGVCSGCAGLPRSLLFFRLYSCGSLLGVPTGVLLLLSLYVGKGPYLLIPILSTF